MSKDFSFLKSLPAHAMPLLVAMCLYVVWFGSIHDTYPWLVALDSYSSKADGLLYSQLVCLARPAGFVMGALAAIASMNRSGSLFTTRSIRAIFLLQLVAHVVSWLGICLFDARWTIAFAVQFSTSFCTSILACLFLRKIEPFGYEFGASAIVCCVLVASLAVFVEKSVPAHTTSMLALAIRGCILCIPLVASFTIIERSALSNAEMRKNPAPERRLHAKFPLPLASHLVLYGFVFGMLHMIGGVVESWSTADFAFALFASVTICVAFSYLFMKKGRRWKVWETIRAVVFPLTIIGFLLVPASLSSNAASTAISSAELLYDMVFVHACLILMRISSARPFAIVAKGILLKNIGAFLGGLFSITGLEGGRLLVGAMHLNMAVLVVGLLAVATFWVGSDQDIDKVWGLRKKLDPKYLYDKSLRQRCETASEQYGLTPRESGILLALSQGKTPSAIAEELVISVHTVRAHIRSIHTKLEVHSLPEIEAKLKSIKIDERQLWK